MREFLACEQDIPCNRKACNGSEIGPFLIQMGQAPNLLFKRAGCVSAHVMDLVEGPLM